MKRWDFLAGILFLVVAALLVGCGRGNVGLDVYLRTNAAEIDKPASVDDRSVRFEVAPGTPARTIGQKLEQAGLIRDATLFEAFVRVNGLDSRLAAGTFTLAPSMTLREVVETLTQAQAAAIKITLPEGWRVEQAAEYLSRADLLGPVEGARYRDQAVAGDLTGLEPGRYPFLQERPAGATLEGYLFPDTYLIPAAAPTAIDVLTRQLDTFAQRVPPLYRDAQAAGATQMSLHEVITLASIVEREAVVPEERPAIAGVYLNRLAAGMKLDADPTVQYAMGYQPATGQWWKTPVFLEEYGGVDSLYNTYLYPGLPPGPIAAPGLSSIRAVLYPEQHDYLYFVAIPDGSGRHVFATTFAEHEENVRRYLSGG
ncbi:MAG TPA: endolytic transglycosylase MltG [Chloroflexi bacterium]|nr:endolytic transglycosylase MltG [Chloroflexota bacterium]